MSNTFGADILIQAKDPMKAAGFYVKELGFKITDKAPNMVSLHGKNINLLLNEVRRLDLYWKLRSRTFRKPKRS
jgi:hypothetical protein